MSEQTRRYMSKRQRPCDSCRVRKTACRIEGGPPCRLCFLHARDCTFNESAPPRKRNTPSGTAREAARDSNSPMSLDNTIENRDIPLDVNSIAQAPQPTQDAIRLLPGGMESIHDPSIIEFENINESLLSDMESHWFQHIGSNDVGDEFHFQIPSTDESGIPGMVMNGLEQQNPSPPPLAGTFKPLLDTNEPATPQILGYSAEMDPFLLQNYQYDASGRFRFKELTIQSVQQGPNPVQFLLSQPSIYAKSRDEAGHVQAATEVLREELGSILSADMGSRLISLYHQFIAPQCPIFTSQTMPDPRVTPPYLLAAIYLIVQPFSSFDENLFIEMAYDAPNSAALLKFIYKCLSTEAHSPSLPVVQTLFLLVMCPSLRHLVSDAPMKWNLLGSLISSAQTLGLHINPKRWAIAPWQIAQRRRISFLIYAIDKWMACSLGRPPFLHPDNWLVTSLEDADVVESGLSPEDWQDQMHYSELSNILADVLRKLYSLRSIDALASDYRKSLVIARPLLEELSAWQQHSLTRDQTKATKTEPPRSLLNICRIGYHYVQLTVFRAIIRPFLIPTADSFPPDQFEAFHFARIGIKSCTTAAFSIVKDLNPEQSNLFWPQWTQIAFSSISYMMLLMAVSSPDSEEAVAWFTDLQASRKELRVKAKLLPALRLGLLRIDSVFWKGIDNVLKLKPHVSDALNSCQSKPGF